MASRSEPSGAGVIATRRRGRRVSTIAAWVGFLPGAKSSVTPSDSLFSGVRRVRRHFPDALPHDVAVAYGGEEFQQRSGGRLIPWRMLRQAALANADPVIRVFAGGRPLADAGILALFANNTWKRAKTAKDGEAALDLHSSHLPLALFVAARGFAAHLERAWIPAERELHLDFPGWTRNQSVVETGCLGCSR